MTCQRQREQPRLLLSDPARQTHGRTTAVSELGALGCAGPHILANSEPSPQAGSPSLGTRTAGPGAAEQKRKEEKGDEDDDDGAGGTWEWSTGAVPERLSSRSNFAEVGQ